ncbi:CAAD domain-containing protein [Calothrix sp. UHCC 0171]|uniref:CAAD domain-containing protein n=1 Tax=Calothrix sp. UHCC 0171 TaxID=3110245 RepID=UPI002B20A8BF|nr:CAAD domain-containing protein [Calothrix sp. UHCC 0171]MEA5570282.1 CAAD domain-containing protein [Calothrix sp. UHCC 0171]
MTVQEPGQNSNSEINPTVSNGTNSVENLANDSLPKLPPVDENTLGTQWQKFSSQVAIFLEKLPEYIGNFWTQYKVQITSIVLIIAALISVKIVLAILKAINEIPLIAFFFELVGIAYIVWFIWRYILKASTRQELLSQINSFKKQIIGNDDL